MKTIFLSDLHLGANYISDHHAHEKKICRFLLENASDADQIYLLGDILDYWYEYKYVVPRGFVRFFGTLASLADKGVKITWLTGNHDIWLFDYLKNEIGIEVIDASSIERRISGKLFVMAHGDRIGSSNLSFKVICRLFRSKVCQRLFASIHPRWTVPFAHRWSSNSRYSHQLIDNEESEHRKLIIEDAHTLLKAYPDANYIILGHHHVALEENLAGSKAIVMVLGDWIENFTYAVFDGQNLELKRAL